MEVRSGRQGRLSRVVIEVRVRSRRHHRTRHHPAALVRAPPPLALQISHPGCRILVEPEANLIRQQQALLETEGVSLTAVVTKLRDMSPLYELAKEGVDLSTMVWQTEGH